MTFSTILYSNKIRNETICAVSLHTAAPLYYSDQWQVPLQFLTAINSADRRHDKWQITTPSSPILKVQKKTYHYEVINILKRFVLRQNAFGTHCLPDQQSQTVIQTIYCLSQENSHENININYVKISFLTFLQVLPTFLCKNLSP